MTEEQVRALIGDVRSLRHALTAGTPVSDQQLADLERQLGAMLPPIRGQFTAPLDAAGVNRRPFRPEI